MKVVHCPLASPNVTSFNVDVGASATPSFFFLRNLTLPTKWLAEIETAQYQGMLSGIQAQIGRAQQCVGGLGFGDQAAALIGTRCAEAMKELLRMMML